MVRNCKKCGTANANANGSPLEACPKCGAIYAKVESAQSKPRERKSSWVALAVPLGIVLLLAALGAFAWYRYHDQQIRRESVAALKDVSRKFYDVMRVAEVTGRIALSTPLQNMQAIARDARSLNLHACASDAKAHFSKGSEQVISGYITFAGERGGDAGGTTMSTLADGAQELAKVPEALKTCGNFE